MVKLDSKDKRYGGIGAEAVKKATGMDWNEWFDVLDKLGATTLTHREITELIHANYAASQVSGWWSQMITVGYEQARGLREKHQTLTGYSVNVSRTIDVSVDELYKSWTNKRTLSRWLSEPIGVSSSVKNKSIRASWSDGRTRISVGFLSKGKNKSQVAVEHQKLKNRREVERMREFWVMSLESLRVLITD